MYKRFHPELMERIGKDALEAINGLGVSHLTNHPGFCHDRDKHSDGKVCTHEAQDEPCTQCSACNPNYQCEPDVFWYAEEGLETRYKQERAKVGDNFWDGNNRDKHEVIAVDLDSQRLVYRNLNQNEQLLDIAVWG